MPGTVRGTTAGSTVERFEFFNSCASNDGSVWYSFTSGQDGGVVANLQADGDLDASVEVFLQRRSGLISQGCDATDNNGKGAVKFPTGTGQRYLIRVSRRVGSADSTFSLRFDRGRPPAQPPGRRLGRRGSRGTLDRVLRQDAAYNVFMRSRRPYRFNLVHGRYCMRTQIFPPGTSDFGADTPVKTLPCGGYGGFTPPAGGSGRYVFHVDSDRAFRQSEGFRLIVGPTKADDLAPGIFLGNYATAHGRVNGGALDDVDVYRFDITRRSALDLDLSSPSGTNLRP